MPWLFQDSTNGSALPNLPQQDTSKPCSSSNSAGRELALIRSCAMRRHSAALSPLPRRPEHRLGLGAGTAQAGGYERCPAQPIPSSSSSSFALFWFLLLSHEHVPTVGKEAARLLVAPCPHRHGSRARKAAGSDCRRDLQENFGKILS